MKMLKNVLIGLCIIFLAGCSAKSQFIYDHPVEKVLAGHADLVAAVMPVVDLREDEKAIDQIFADDPLQEIQKIIKEELILTGHFSEVILQQDNQPGPNADVIFIPELSKMQWMVPNYDEMMGKVFVISFLTGGIGGIAYGSSETEVIGDVSLKLMIVERSTNNVLHEKIYTGHFTEKMKKLSCDTPETKATAVGKSLKDAMTHMSSDLDEVFSEYLITGLEVE